MHKLIISADTKNKFYWRDLWEFRELFAILAWRDISVRYKQTIFGILWALLRPLLTMIVFTIVFSRIAGLPSAGSAPYPLMVLAGMLPWILFSSALSDASTSLMSNSNLISKVYFPRMIIPVASIFVSLVDFLLSLSLLILLMIYYKFMPNWQILYLPFFVFLAFLASLGPGLLIASLNVKYRDFRYIIPFVLQLGMYISPVGFNSAIVPEKWQLLYSLNPVVGVIDGFRWCILGGEANIISISFLISLSVLTLLLWLGIRVFRKNEKSLADLI